MGVKIKNERFIHLLDIDFNRFPGSKLDISKNLSAFWSSRLYISYIFLQIVKCFSFVNILLQLANYYILPKLIKRYILSNWVLDLVRLELKLLLKKVNISLLQIVCTSYLHKWRCVNFVLYIELILKLIKYLNWCIKSTFSHINALEYDSLGLLFHLDVTIYHYLNC